MIFAVYDKNTGEIVKSIDIPSFMVDIMTLKTNELRVEIPRMANDATEYIKDGVLTPKPIADNTAE